MDEVVTLDVTTGVSAREPMTAAQQERRQRVITESRRIEQERETERANREVILAKVAAATGVTVAALKVAFHLGGPPSTPQRP